MHTNRQNFGPPRQGELEFSKGATLVNLSESDLDNMTKDGFFKGSTIEQARDELSKAALVLKELLHIPFLQERNGYAFRRVPEKWVHDLESLQHAIEIPSIANIVRFLRDPEKCKPVEYYSTYSGEIKVLEFEFGSNNKFVYEYMRLRQCLEATCRRSGIIKGYLFEGRPKLTWEVGEKIYTLKALFQNDRLQIRDVWGNEFEMVGCNTSRGDEVRVFSIEGPNANYYADLLKEPCIMHNHALVPKECLVGDRAGLSSNLTVTMRPSRKDLFNEPDLQEAALEENGALSLTTLTVANLVDNSEEKGKINRKIILPNSITISPEDPLVGVVSKHLRLIEQELSKEFFQKLQSKLKQFKNEPNRWIARIGPTNDSRLGVVFSDEKIEVITVQSNNQVTEFQKLSDYDFERVDYQRNSDSSTWRLNSKLLVKYVDWVDQIILAKQILDLI